MSKGKEIENEDERPDECRIDENQGKKRVAADSGDIISVSLGCALPKRISLCQTNIKDNGSSSIRPQDADYSYVPSLSDELENLILARVPRSENWKFLFINKRILCLVKSGELFKIRREIGVTEPSVFIFAAGDNSWWVFDRQFNNRRRLPDIPADPCFLAGDRESLCAGTHLIISGREINGVVIWRYELETNSWRNGPSMIAPRCLFASASCSGFAFVAGGVILTETGPKVLSSAEKYNPDTQLWEPLPRMHKRRRLCSGCYMDNKFFVIGGYNEDGEGLTCGEAYDENRNTWELIPDMLESPPVATSQSPPLVAVVNNQLYSLETLSNELKVFLKSSKTWKKLGSVPVRADFHKGWGVAFKSLGNELLVIGESASTVTHSDEGMAIYACCPDSKAEELQWRPLAPGRNRLSNFIWNCSVMSC